jgi:hypothetical protein
MTVCLLEHCSESITKQGHTLCYPHWKARSAGELAACGGCGRLKEDPRPLCNSCFKSMKTRPVYVSPARAAGQGAREMADELARKGWMRGLLSKLTGGFVKPPGHSWRVGAASEEAVGRELLRLRGHWSVRHDIMIGRNWNADHVVVGSPGAFVLDTKFRSGVVKTSWSGIRVNGRKTNLAEKAQDQAREISQRLRHVSGMKQWVQPVLVFDNDVRGRFEPDGVHLVGLSQLVDYLTEMPPLLNFWEIEAIEGALLDDGTWLL